MSSLSRSGLASVVVPSLLFALGGAGLVYGGTKLISDNGGKMYSPLMRKMMCNKRESLDREISTAVQNGFDVSEPLYYTSTVGERARIDSMIAASDLRILSKIGYGLLAISGLATIGVGARRTVKALSQEYDGGQEPASRVDPRDYIKPINS